MLSPPRSKRRQREPETMRKLTKNGIASLCSLSLLTTQFAACAPMPNQQQVQLLPGQAPCPSPGSEPRPPSTYAMPDFNIHINVPGLSTQLNTAPSPQQREAEARWRSPHPVSAWCTGVLTPIGDIPGKVAGKTIIFSTDMSAAGSPLQPQTAAVYFSRDGMAYSSDAPG